MGVGDQGEMGERETVGGRYPESIYFFKQKARAELQTAGNSKGFSVSPCHDIQSHLPFFEEFSPIFVSTPALQRRARLEVA